MIAVAKRGFSLIEVMTVMVLSGLVAGVIVNIIIGAWRSQLVQEAISKAQGEARFVVNTISTEAHQSSSVINSLVSGPNTYVSNASSVVLRLDSINSNGDIITGIDYLIFRQNPNDLKITERVVVADPASARVAWPGSLTLSGATAALEIHYFDSAGNELEPLARASPFKVYAAPVAGDLTPTSRMVITSTITKTAQLQSFSRNFEQTVSLRNKQ